MQQSLHAYLLKQGRHWDGLEATVEIALRYYHGGKSRNVITIDPGRYGDGSEIRCVRIRKSQCACLSPDIIGWHHCTENNSNRSPLLLLPQLLSFCRCSVFQRLAYIGLFTKKYFRLLTSILSKILKFHNQTTPTGFLSKMIWSAKVCVLTSGVWLLSIWAKSWQLDINISKCSVYSIHHKSKYIIQHPQFINGSQLTNSSSVTHFRTLVDSRLTFNLPISNILIKATQSASVFSVDLHRTIQQLLEK